MNAEPDPLWLAALHARVFDTPRPWSAAEFRSLLAGRGTFLLPDRDGFLLGRSIADEAELLTLAVSPDCRRQGIGTRLVAGFLDRARAEGATHAFLEVAGSNPGAIALYRAAGFAESGRRRGYYHAPDGRRIDAVAMARAL